MGNNKHPTLYIHIILVLFATLLWYKIVRISYICQGRKAENFAIVSCNIPGAAMDLSERIQEGDCNSNHSPNNIIAPELDSLKNVFVASSSFQSTSFSFQAVFCSKSLFASHYLFDFSPFKKCHDENISFCSDQIFSVLGEINFNDDIVLIFVEIVLRDSFSESMLTELSTEYRY